jgi:hypothetical protein
MSRWKPKHNKDEVIAHFQRHPTQKSTEIAKLLGCEPAYVRATLARAGYKLHRSKLDGPSLCGIAVNRKKRQKIN